jgi:peptidoglycan-N-acetylglucosamine deacetylase
LNRRAILILAALTASSTANAYEPGKFYFQGKTHEKVIALTFDDGPGSFTPQILDLLKAHGIRATFFMEGDQVATHSAAAKQVRDAGHEIGNHTFTHANFNTPKTADRQKFISELDATEAAIEKATGVKTRIMRMPHGAFGKYNRAWLLPTLKEKGYALVHWTFGTDWFLKKPAQQMAQEYIQNAHPGAVFLFHDGGRHREKTLEALQVVIPALEAKGYRFVAAEDLLSPPAGTEPPPSKPGAS